MKRSNALLSSGIVLCLTVTLSACTRPLPSVVELHIANVEVSTSDQQACMGGLSVSFRAGSLVMNHTVAPNESEILKQNRPADAPNGTTVSLEAWCYGETDERGYFRLERPWFGSVANEAVFVRPPVPPEKRETCLTGTEERGEAPCVSSGLLK